MVEILKFVCPHCQEEIRVIKGESKPLSSVIMCPTCGRNIFKLGARKDEREDFSSMLCSGFHMVGR